MRRFLPIYDRKGTAALEFALVAFPLFMLIIGMVECSLRLWTWQVLAAAAGDAARCAGVNAASCASVATSSSATKAYAVSAAVKRGFGQMTASNVTVSTGSSAQAACNGTSASVVSVALKYTYSSTMLVPLPLTISGAACFPLASS